MVGRVGCRLALEQVADRVNGGSQQAQACHGAEGVGKAAGADRQNGYRRRCVKDRARKNRCCRHGVVGAMVSHRFIRHAIGIVERRGIDADMHIAAVMIQGVGNTHMHIGAAHGADGS